MKNSIMKLHPDKDGNSKVLVSVQNNYSIVYGMDVIDNRDDDDDYAISIDMYFTGDLDILFMMMERSGYSVHYCLFCRLKRLEWGKIHSDRDSIHCGAENWAI